eukprot:INCI6055.1.p1 GENE.INCI6055.1~~INCI6055.1.p1  ORF type:complete len:361 (-),score=68.69 INCI6055.1:821-1903(-)
MPATIRLFVSGNRSQVGKSSVCLGILGSLLQSGYAPHEVSYIKPATQCTKKTLVAEFCERNGVKSRHIGPIVYYSGFTRKFLEGETESSAEMLDKVRVAVDDIAKGVKVCIIDGVGYPAVGSICGVDNAALARAAGAAVVLVAKAGVGDGIDSFNLDANWFLSRGVPVLGAIYNRFQNSGYYSLAKCRPYLEKYFELRREQGAQQRIYGYVPELAVPSDSDEISTEKRTKSAENDAATSNVRHEKPSVAAATAAEATKGSSAFVERLIRHVHEHVRVVELIADATRATAATFKIEPRSFGQPKRKLSAVASSDSKSLPAEHTKRQSSESESHVASPKKADTNSGVQLSFDFGNFTEEASA